MHPVEQYLVEMRGIFASGNATPETSYYGPLARLLNHVGATLKPKVDCLIQPSDAGAGRPDGHLYTRLPRTSRAAGVTYSMGLTPDRGVIEAKPLADSVPAVANSAQVSSYLGLYKNVLVTNFRDFMLVQDQGRGKPPAERERFELAASAAEFWALAADAKGTADRLGDRLVDFLVRVMLVDAPVDSPQQVASFLASYAREARGRLEGADIGLSTLRTAIEEALGLKFQNDDAENFFESTIVQTLFYGLFSGWVIWHGEKPGRSDAYDWKTASWSLHVPAVRALFEQLARPTGAGRLGLSDPLDWASRLLNRVKRERFFARFEQEHAVQYFYEPFLKEFDPGLRKQLGVWYTPPEVVSYMVARVDTALREELGIADGLADPSVYVLDPCCGTGAYLVEVLRRIEATLKANRGNDALIGADVKRAAMERIFGFEIMPAPFVVSHLQLGLHLRKLRAPLTGDERPAVYLTNALTGWEPGTHPKVLLPELEAERDAAEHVKRDRPILVVLGNPPYNGYAGVAVDEERGLTTAYRATSARVPKPKGQGLNDLYVRFFRMAERRITEYSGRGVVCFISNYSWLDGLSFTGMREQYLERFDRIWVDSLNGDKYRTGKLTPEGLPDPSIFSTESNREGIQVGTAITLLVRTANHSGARTVAFRQLWGAGKRAQLAKEAASTLEYTHVTPAPELGLPFTPAVSAAGYTSWPSLPELFPVSYPGVKTSRDQLVVDIDRDRLVARMKRYFDPRVSDEEMTREVPSAMDPSGGFAARETRRQLLARGFREDYVAAFAYRPFDQRWFYWERETRLLDRKREEMMPIAALSNVFLAVTQQNRKDVEPAPAAVVAGSLHLVERGANLVPLKLDERARNLSPLAAQWPGPPDGLFFHALACLHSPAYLADNLGPLRQDWPRIPLAGPELLESSAKLGNLVAALVAAVDDPVPSVTGGKVSGELRHLGTLTAPADPNLLIHARWGIAGQGGVAMPGTGQTNHRAYLPDELAALSEGAAAAGRTPEDFLACLGGSTVDVYLNATTYWKNVPTRVWEFRMGGYQVLKKWLSYRESALLGRPLTPVEAGYFRDVVRRIAALLLLGPALDDNYRAARDNALPWPRET